MLISHRHKLITIDIPKTGSRSLRESLYPMGIIDVVGKPYPNEAFYQHGTALDCVRDFEKSNCNFHDYYYYCVHNYDSVITKTKANLTDKNRFY